MRENVGIEPSNKHPVDDVAQEHLQLQRGSLPRVLWVLFMDLFVNSANRVAISDLEFGEILVFGIESLIKIGNDLEPFFALPQLDDNPFQLDKKVTL